MTEPTYLISLTETERTAIARVLGGLVTKLVNAPLQIPATVEAPTGGTQAARAVLSPSTSQPTRPPSPPAVAPSVTPIEQRDRWDRNRKGAEVPHPEGCEVQEVHLWKTEQKKAKTGKGADFLKVTWQSNGSGYVDANCFDSQLFPWLIKSQGQKTTIYTVRSGQYLNVVGVRA